MLDHQSCTLRQGCTMAPSLFNLYACEMAERWIDSIGEQEGSYTLLLYKLDPAISAVTHTTAYRLNKEGAIVQP